MLSFLRAHLLLQLPFRLLSMLPILVHLFLAILTQIRALNEVKVARENFTLVTPVALFALMLTWHYKN